MILIPMIPITVKRKTAGSYDNSGIFQQGVESDLSIDAHIFPATEEEIEFLPEGTDLNSTFKVKTLVPLLVNKDSLSADRVIYNGVEYQVISCGDWSTNKNLRVLKKYYRSFISII